MTRLQKSYPIASFKRLPDEGEGTFEAVVSVIGNVDHQGDVVMSGAFDKTIDNWKSAGDPLPVLWSHDWGDPFAHIGYVLPEDMREIKGNQKAGIPPGLLVKGHLDVHKPFAKQVYDLLSERRVKEFSFSYEIPPGGEKRGKNGENELHVVDLIEVGPTLKGANNQTVSLGTKSDGTYLTDDERYAVNRLTKARDEQLAFEKSWDGAAAMKSCHSAADYRKIAFERANDSDPDTAAHWALPHHNSPGADANPAGVSAALGALNGARSGAPDLKNTEAARKHLEAHGGAEKRFDPSQPRDADGRWAGGGPENLTESERAYLGSEFHVGQRVVTPDGEGKILDITATATDPWATVEVDGIDDEYPLRQLRPKSKAAESKPAESKPWHVEERDGKYCVVGNTDDISDGDCFETEAEAEAQIRAMYANEKSLGSKAGRVLGAKAVSALKSKLDSAIDEFVAEINGGPAEGEKDFSERLHPRDSDGRFTDGGGHSTGSGQHSSGTPEQEAEAGAILEELVGSGLLDEDTLDEVADPMWGAYDALKDLINGGHVDEETVNEIRRRVSKSEELPPGDKKEFALGYGDGSVGREKRTEGKTLEYLRGYQEGQDDRLTRDQGELKSIDEQLAALKIKTT